MASRNPTDGVLEALVEGWDSETLFQVRDQVREVVAHQGYDALRNLIEEGLQNAQIRLTRGPTLEQAQYARSLGFMAGMEVLLRLPGVIAEVADKREAKLEKATEEPSERTR